MAQTLTNWNRSADSRPREVVTPTTVDRIRHVIRDPVAFPSPVRAGGQLHSTTPCFGADGGTHVSMDTLNEIVSVTDNRITVQAGATMLQIRDELRKAGRKLQLAVAPEIGNATAGSVACSGTKDSTLHPRQAADIAQIGSLVREVKMIDATGRLVRVLEGGAEDLETHQPVPDLDLPLVRSSYGLLGIIYEVTFETTPLVPLLNRFETEAMWRGSASYPVFVSIDDIFDGADAVLGFLAPYRGSGARKGKILVERRRTLPVSETPTESDVIRRLARDWVWEWGGHLAPTYVTGLADALRSRGCKPAAVKAVLEQIVDDSVTAIFDSPASALLALGLASPFGGGSIDARQNFVATMHDAFRVADAATIDELLAQIPAAIAMFAGDPDPGRPTWVLDLLDKLPGPVLGALGNFRAYRSDSLIDFTKERDAVFDFTFWAFPQSRWSEIVQSYLAFCDQHEGETGFRPTLFTEIYFICRDTQSLLSFSPDEPVFTLDIVDSRPNDEGWKAMNRAYNHWAVQHGGRPLFNQTKQLETTPNARNLMRTTFGPALWAQFSRAVWAANPPLPQAPSGRFPNAYFQALLDPRPAVVSG